MRRGRTFVVTRVASKLRSIWKKKLGVEKCVVVVDELNKLALSDGLETYLQEDASRYLGARPLHRAGSVQRAAVPRSQVHKRAVGNCGTSMYGRMDMDGFSTPGYQS